MQKIRSLVDSRLIYTGQATGKQYIWDRAGDIRDIDTQDVPELLAKRIGVRSCCGEGLLGNKVFEVYND